MKTYEPRRNNECPNGLHADYDPAKDPTQNECTCPWLIIQSSSPVQHLTSWNRRELENAVREFDRGYFDPPGYPRRTGSMFLSPAMQRLLDVAEKSPVAAALALLAGSGTGLPPFDAIAWDAEDAVMSLRIATGGWWHLFLGHANTEAVTNHDDAHAAGANPVLLWADHPDTARETALPKLNAAWHHEECACDLNDPQQQAGCQRADEFSAAYLPEVSPDVFDADMPATGVTGPAAMPLIFEVPADQIEALRPGNPVYDDLLRQAQAAGNGGMVLLPESLASGGVISQGVAIVGEDGAVSGFDAVREGIATLPRLEDVPLPQRVPQVPSDIAEAGHGDDYCTCDLNLRYTCPLCREALDRVREVEGALSHLAQDSECTCAARGSAPDTYACPEHPASM